MARPSAAALLNAIPTGTPHPLDPPESLTEPQREAWLTCTRSKPADWFPADSAPVLLEYVRAVEMADQLETWIRRAVAEDVPIRELTKLLTARDKESKRLAYLATKLRLTQQSRYTPMAAATATKKEMSRPWKEAA